MLLAFSIKFSSFITFITDNAAAHPRWFPPNVVPSIPLRGLNIPLIRTPENGKPFAIPFATVIISGFIPLH